MRRIAYLAAMSVMLASVSMAGAPTKSGAETGLIGIHLYDSGSKIVAIFGTPNEIQAVTLGGSGAAGGGGAPGGFGGPPGVPGASGNGGGGKGGNGGGTVATAGYTGPIDSSEFGFGDSLLQAGPPGVGQGVPPQGGPRGARGPGMGPGPVGGPPGGVPGVPNIPGAGAGGGSTEKTVFTRWIYNRAGSKYGFVMDKFSRVVQIEAIGISNPRVHTARGIAFGSSFAQIVKKYNKNPDGSANSPDGYDISGDTIVVRYLVKNKVAFRLARLGKDKPQVVTGIAVAAGKL